MSRTVVIQALATGLGKMQVSKFDPITGNTVSTNEPLTQADIWKFHTTLANQRQELYEAIKPMLAKGGFEFAPQLWKWEVKQPNRFQLQYWVTITFLDPYNDYSKDEFMGFIKQTGILNFDFKIIKPWG